MNLQLSIVELKRLHKEVIFKVNQLREAGKVIYPPSSDVLNCFENLHFKDVKVVILGQDPYHGPDQAHGLSFSVKKGVDIPPSLNNIIKELKSDVGIKQPTHGCLESWTQQGVLLLNRVMTVEEGQPKSHANLGWEKFTDEVISILNTYYSGIVFMLWGSDAKKVGDQIDRSRHLVLTSVHPSPLSASKGFFGCKHFSKANEYLQSIGKDPINWNIE